MQKYLDESFSEAKVQAELVNPQSFFFIAWEDNNPVGYLKLNVGGAQTEPQNTSAMEIERIYVQAAWHGKKVGQLLYDKALATAQEQGKAYLWLGVWEENVRAIRFYEKNGFVAFDKHIFRIGQDEQTDIMMKKML
ncbi:GNAT family N-acetyltransferase [Chitinophaga sedimenti]|uniref:GNAT family N-acetyltransferase n=1 Tax=Chitinophaga sedimenti TaxID=2033606 RepID=UPI002003BF1E|nr:GNAT family N-acetyltransferase [Chitinophaga sedimenti]MCK7554012.1 GNAT family N-acetyltransferase [Chitinophaga sedimenti]